MDIKETLAVQLPFFLEKDLKKEIANKGKLMDVPVNQVILNEGSYVKVIPILLSGLIKVVKYENGKEMLLYYIQPLESCIVSFNCSIKNEKSNVKAITESDCKILVIPAFDVENWKNKYVSFNSYFLNMYQARFEGILDAFNSLAFQQLDQRILTYLAAKSRALATNELHLTHQELSDELGAARETTSRLLKKLEIDGNLKLHRGWIELLIAEP